MATSASGPTMAGGMQPIVKDGYELLYLPDVHNDALQREGNAPVFYWCPNYVRIARKNGPDTGDYLFNLIRFAGIQSADTTVGATAERQVAGGVLTFTATAAPPEHVLRQSQQEIIDRWRASGDFFWGIRSNAAPVFRPVPIVQNVTSISNLSPLANGTFPSGAPGPAAPAAPAGGGNGAPPGRALTSGPQVRQVPTPLMRDMPRIVPASRDLSSDSNLDPWYWNLQGQGNGSIDPMGQNAYSALVGAYPTAVLWQAFHGTASPIVVMQALKMKMWVPLVEIHVKGKWKRIFDHFAAHATGHYLWFSADIKAEYNNLRASGDLEVQVLVDPTLPGADKIQELIDKRTDLVFTKFMEQAQRVIFEPAPQVTDPAPQQNSVSPWGVGLALNYRHDSTSLELEYHEKREMAYLQDQMISSSMSGMFEEMKRDPDAEKKYFLSVNLDDWPRKLGRVFKPVVNYPRPDQHWAGQPVSFLSAQVGYPNAQGELMWTGHLFQSTDPEGATWNIGITQKPAAEVAHPPAGWAPDKTFIKRSVHLLEPPSIATDPFVRVQIDANQIDLDPPEGRPVNDVVLEVRADSAGSVSVGPISLGVELESSKQTVEVTFEPTNATGSPVQREPVKFQWSFSDQQQPRFWSIFSNDPEFRAFYRYKVRAIVKGSLFSKGSEWEGPWIATSGNGPITVSVPTPDDPGVVKRELPSFALEGSGAQPPATSPPAAPPPSPSPSAPPPPQGGPPPPTRGDRPGVWSVGEPSERWTRQAPPPAPGSDRSVEGPAASGPAGKRGTPAGPPAIVVQEAGLEVAGWRVD